MESCSIAEEGNRFFSFAEHLWHVAALLWCLALRYVTDYLHRITPGCCDALRYSTDWWIQAIAFTEYWAVHSKLPVVCWLKYSSKLVYIALHTCALFFGVLVAQHLFSVFYKALYAHVMWTVFLKIHATVPKLQKSTVLFIVEHNVQALFENFFIPADIVSGTLETNLFVQCLI